MLPAARALGCCTAVLVLLAVAVPAATARPSTPAERLAAANAFAQRTLSFERQQAAARDDALRVLDDRRRSVQACLSVWQAAPLARRGDLGLVYFEYLSGALWTVDAPIFRHWITDLRRSARIDRSPVLARTAEALRRDYVIANGVYTAVPDACAAVTTWRDAGWAAAAKPAVLRLLDRLVAGSNTLNATEIAKGGRQLVRYARRGKLAAEVLRVGVDEPDARVNAHTGCDAVGALLQPDVYVCSASPIAASLAPTGRWSVSRMPSGCADRRDSATYSARRQLGRLGLRCPRDGEVPAGASTSNEGRRRRGRGRRPVMSFESWSSTQ